MLLPEGRAILEQAKPVELFSLVAALLKHDHAVDYATVFANILMALQKTNQSESFGLCKTCLYFTKAVDGFVCGLSKEPLSKSDKEKICQEHTVA